MKPLFFFKVILMIKRRVTQNPHGHTDIQSTINQIFNNGFNNVFK